MRMSLPVLIALVFSFSYGLSAEPGQETKSLVNVITIDGGITPYVADYIKTSIDKAHENKAAALLINLDTPGGLYDSTRHIVQDILKSPVPIIVYVSPEGARAGSAGVFIALAAHILAMAPSSNIGAAHPVDISGSDVEGDMKEKITNDAKAWARSIAETRGRNADWAEKAVVGSESISAQHALSINVIDTIALDIPELLSTINSKKIKLGHDEITLQVKDASLIEIPMSFRQSIMDFLSNPNLIYILMLLGILGLVIEFQSPGLIIPGLFGLICLAVVFFVQVLPINWFGALLIFLAAACFVAEIFITSFGVLAVGGLILLVTGSYLLFSGSVFFIDQWVIWTISGGFAAMLIFIGWALLKARRQGPTANIDAMVGEIGLVVDDIFPDRPGKILFRGSFWQAYAKDPIEKDVQVKVIRVDSTNIFVERKKD